MIKGIDVASFQHPNGAAIDWHKVKADGIAFVYVKATEGVGYVNPYFKQDVAGARQAGLKVGVYHFFHGDQDGVTQANEFVKATEGIHFDLPHAIDYEVNNGQPQSVTHHRLDQLRTVLRQHGLRTATYTFPSFWATHGDASCKFCGSDSLWYSDTGIKEAPKAPKPWAAVTVWQYSGDAARINGISGKVDEDGFLGDTEQFASFSGTHPTAPKTTLPAWYHRLLQYPPSNLRNPGETAVHNGVRYQRGSDVEKVQRKLAIRPDGFYGPTTASHVKGFQHAHGLHPDGIVGPDTARKLGS